MSNKVKKMNISVMREILQDMNYDGERSFMMNEDFGISQIADALKFPNDSFFCMYFRRLTGFSPTEYRNS